MTTAAWDGNKLAIDRQITDDDMAVEGDKMYHLENQGIVIVAAGSIPTIQDTVDLIQQKWQQKIPWFMVEVDDDEDSVDDLEIIIFDKRENAIYYLDKMLRRSKIYGHTAIGSGRAFAIGAMDAGTDAVEAVSIAARNDINTGIGIDWYDSKTGRFQQTKLTR